MRASLAEMLQPIEVTSRPSTELSVLLNLVAVIAVGAALLFGVGRSLVSAGPLNDFSSASAEVAADAS